MLSLLIFKCYLLWKAHGTELTHFSRVISSGTYFSAESSEAMWIKCLAKGHIILMQSGFVPSVAIAINRHLTHMTNVLHDCFITSEQLV